MLPDYWALAISMLPFALVSCSWQPPEPMVPFNVSPPILPVEVTGNSEEIRPKDVRADRLYPTPSGIRTRMEEKEDLSEISPQPLAGRVAVTPIAPF